MFWRGMIMLLYIIWLALYYKDKTCLESLNDLCKYTQHISIPPITCWKQIYWLRIGYVLGKHSVIHEIYRYYIFFEGWMGPSCLCSSIPLRTTLSHSALYTHCLSEDTLNKRHVQTYTLALCLDIQPHKTVSQPHTKLLFTQILKYGYCFISWWFSFYSRSSIITSLVWCSTRPNALVTVDTGNIDCSLWL